MVRYDDIVVDCWALATDSIPEIPEGESFRAHTLFAPALPSEPTSSQMGGRLVRPDPSYAQPSARYLKLITDGADELRLPQEYKTYLHGIRSYQTTTARQKLGQYIFLAIWQPVIMFLFGISRTFAGEDGLYPPWIVALFGIVFRAVWISYDDLFRNLFGDGERTVKQDAGKPVARDKLHSMVGKEVGDGIV